MFYLDDFAVWVRTQKGSILRAVICAVMVLIAGVTVYKGLSSGDDLQAQIDANNEVLAKDTYDLNVLDQRIAEADSSVPTGDVFVPSEAGGDAIVYLQNKYSGLTKNGGGSRASVEEIQSGNPNGTSAIDKAGLDAYVSSSAARNPWFPNTNITYAWECNSSQPVIMDAAGDLPGIFTCFYGSRKDNYLVSVAVGTFDTSTGMLKGVSVYRTYIGKIYNDTGSSDFTRKDSPKGDILEYDRYGRDELAWRSYAVNGGQAATQPETTEPGTETEPEAGTGTETGTETEPETVTGTEQGDAEGEDEGPGFDLGGLLGGMD